MMNRALRILRHVLTVGPGDAATAPLVAADAAALFAPGATGVFFDRGRTAMFALLKSVGVATGDEVILSAYTCHSVPQAIRALGATNAYVDIDPVNFGPDPADVERAISPRTRAILVQHSYGWPAHIEAIVEIGRRHGIPIVEDCCQTLGARIGGRALGSFGVAAFCSFQWNKPISAGSGGLAVVHDPGVASRVRAFREEHSRDAGFAARKLLAAELLAFEMLMYPRTAAWLTRGFRALSRILPLSAGTDAPGDDARARDDIDRFRALTPLQADLIRLELARIDAVIQHRRGIAQRLRTSLAEMGFDVLREPANHFTAPLRLPVRVRDPLGTIHAARAHGFELTTWFDVPLDPLAEFRPESDYRPGQCPRAERAAREIVLIPTGLRVTPRVEWRIERFFRIVRDAQRG